MTCPLCQHRFEQAEAGCSRCPLSTNCHVICCPNCGYQFVEHSSIVEFFRRLTARWRRREGSMS